MIKTLLADVRVLPVVTLDRAEDAVPVATALLAGGIGAIEITLRTAAALDAIAAVASAVPEMLVGAGTATRAADLVRARSAGARFAVSPGLTGDLARAAHALELPLLPGVMTPSEAMIARDAGFDHLKLFPATAAGGLELLRALAGPLPKLRFCPTGGIDPSAMAGWLALPNVFCVGGSWLTPPSAIRAGDWARIELLAREAGSRGTHRA